MTNIKYSAYFNANSGMAEAARNFVMAFDAAGMGITTEIVPNIDTTRYLGSSYEFCQNHAGLNLPYDTKIIHITPDNVFPHLEPLRKNIFHLFWETDRLPEWFVWQLNHSVDEIWTGSAYNKKAFERSGIKPPVWICPQPLNPVPEDTPPLAFPNRPEFLFGAVGQWIERKGFEHLVTSFLEEFRGDHRVGLFIKTYKEHFTQEETREIVDTLKKWRKKVTYDTYPKIYLCPVALGKDTMHRLYKTLDCFVSTQYGEGWGLPIVESMSAGVPVISTNLGGCHEHIPEEYWYPLSYTMKSVHDMNWVRWYTSDQQWGEPNIDSIRSAMRDVYEHRLVAQKKAQLAQTFVKDYFSYERIGGLMKDHLEGKP